MSTPKSVASKAFGRALIDAGVIPEGTTAYVIECEGRHKPVMVTARYFAEPSAINRLSSELRNRLLPSGN